MEVLSPTRILLVDDHQLFLEGLRALLSNESDLRIVGQAGDARHALELARQVEHDLMIVDITLPGVNGLALLRDLKRMDHREPVLVLTMHGQSDMVKEALESGAAGYALKRQGVGELVDAVRTTAHGRRYLAPELDGSTGSGNGHALSASWEAGPLAVLSTREREVFDLLLRGHTNADMANLLFISIKTVETHRCRIFRKLAVHNIGDLLRLAARHGMLPAA